MNRCESNVEFISRVMDNSRHGALMQAFVIEAVARYAEEVSEADLPENCFISPVTWKDCAKEFMEEYNKRPNWSVVEEV